MDLAGFDGFRSDIEIFLPDGRGGVGTADADRSDLLSFPRFFESPNIFSGIGSGGSSSENPIIAPQMMVDNGKSRYRVSATRVNMRTGKLEF